MSQMIQIDLFTLCLICAISFSLGIAATCVCVLHANRDRPIR